jgi:hypothetical protein
MNPLSPQEILESLDRIIDSLTECEEAYECIDMAIQLREELESIL